MKRIFLFSLILIVLVPNLKSQVRIKMQNEGGVYTTPCIVNGLKLRFIFDTGASNVSLSLSEAIFMLKNGYLEENDLHGSSYSQIANGDIVENTTVNLKEIEIAGIKIYNVEATIIHELSAPLLLGQSAIKKLGKIQLEEDELLIMESNTIPVNNQCNLAASLIEEAQKHYFNKLDALAADTYQKAYNLCRSVFSCYDIYLMGSSYYFKDDDINAIKYLEEAQKCKPDDSKDFDIALKLAASYDELKKYREAEINCEKALSVAVDDKEKQQVYFRLGYLYGGMGKYQKAIDNYEKSIECYCKTENIDLENAMKSKLQNQTLGEAHYNIAINYLNQNQTTNADIYMYAANLFGYLAAVDYCRKYNIHMDFKK